MWGKLFWRELRIADVMLIIVILVFVAISAYRLSNHEREKSVFVYKNNQLYGEYPLYIDATIVLDEHNIIEIKDKKVRMIKADCPDERCVKQGFSSSLPIMCVPNHVLIEIKVKDADRMLILQ